MIKIPHGFSFGKFSGRMCVCIDILQFQFFSIIRANDICFGFLKVEARMTTMDRSLFTRVSGKFVMVLWSRPFGKG